jgi:ERCC4-type nuclease
VKTLTDIINASVDELVLCPGLGQRKAQRLHALFHEPFVSGAKQSHSKSIQPELVNPTEGRITVQHYPLFCP